VSCKIENAFNPNDHIRFAHRRTGSHNCLAEKTPLVWKHIFWKSCLLDLRLEGPHTNWDLGHFVRSSPCSCCDHLLVSSWENGTDLFFTSTRATARTVPPCVHGACRSASARTGRPLGAGRECSGLPEVAQGRRERRPGGSLHNAGALCKSGARGALRARPLRNELVFPLTAALAARGVTEGPRPIMAPPAYPLESCYHNI